MQTRHDQLLAAGWTYDAASDRYTAPGAANDGTARQYNLAAAWQAYQIDQQHAAPDAPTAPDPAVRRQRDPRRQEPQ